MGIVWFIIAFSVAALTYVFVADSPAFPIWALWVYAWIPGGAGLLWSQLDKTRIPFFSGRKLDLFLSLSGGFVVGGVSFFISQWFYASTFGEVGIKNAVLYLFSYYAIFLLLLFLLFVGGEICWRGYLWEKWRNHPLKGGLGIWLLWTAWLAPVTVAFSKSIFLMAFLNLSLMPFLHYFRMKSKSIIVGTVFYSSICASSIYFQVLFSSNPDYPLLPIIQGSILLIVALMAVWLKRY